MEEEDDRSIKPNSVFLGRLLHGLQRGNQRVIDTNASRAAEKAVGSHGAASLRVPLSRAAKQGTASVRRTALTAAAQQKLILCSALITEVAHTFGFKLRISNPYGINSTTGAAQKPTGPSVAEGSMEEEAGPSQPTEPSTSGDNPGIDFLPLQNLDLEILAEDDIEWAKDLAPPRVVSPRATRKISTVATGSRPKLQLGSRLTASALGEVGLVAGRRVTKAGPAAAATLLAKRAIQLKRQSSLAPEPVEVVEDPKRDNVLANNKVGPDTSARGSALSEQVVLETSRVGIDAAAASATLDIHNKSVGNASLGTPKSKEGTRLNTAAAAATAAVDFVNATGNKTTAGSTSAGKKQHSPLVSVVATEVGISSSNTPTQLVSASVKKDSEGGAASDVEDSVEVRGSSRGKAVAPKRIMAGLFGAAMRDIKKVKKAEPEGEKE